MAKRPSWVCTLITQLSLCLALYVALNLGQPQKSIYQRINGISSNRKGLDFYFISVTGGFRPLEQQTLLLKQVSFSLGCRFKLLCLMIYSDDILVLLLWAWRIWSVFVNSLILSAFVFKVMVFL